MQIKVSRIEDGPACVEVIDPSDGATTHQINVNVGEQVVIGATTAHSPADLSVGEVEAIPTDTSDQVDLGEEASGPVKGGPGVPKPEDQAA